MDMASKFKITLIITLLILAVLTVLTVLPRHIAAQSNSCSEAVGNCNYEFTTNGVPPSYVSAIANITSTMYMQFYTNMPMFAFLYNPDWNMVCGPSAGYYGSTGYWVQGIIAYYVTSGSGGPGSVGNLYLWVQIYDCSGNLVWSNSPASIYYPTYTDVPWPLTSGSTWYIGYTMTSNSIIVSICEEVQTAPPNYATYWNCINIPSQYTNKWFRSNVIWAGSPNGGYVAFYPGAGKFQFCSNSVPLYQGPLAANAAESSNVAYTQMYNQGTTCSMYQDFQT